MTSVQKRPARSMPLHELTASSAMPLASVAANLMPPGVLAKRRLGWVKRRLAFALLALVALLALGYLIAHQATSASRDGLAATQDQTSTLQRNIGAFADVQRLQDQIAQLRSSLAQGMAADVQWDKLVNSVGSVAPRGLLVTDISAKLSAEDLAAVGSALPGAATDGTAGIGTIEVSGTTKDYRLVAAFVDSLMHLKAFTSVEPESLSTANGRSTFTVAAKIGTTALSHRYSTAGGK